MTQKRSVFAAYILLAAGAYGMSAGDAMAAGCNGVVDQFKWGCAAWDNNNGPQYPHYKAPKKTTQPAAKVAPPKAAPVVRAPQPHNPSVAPNGNRIISRDGAGLIGHDGATLIGQDGAGLVGNAGGTMRRK